MTGSYITNIADFKKIPEERRARLDASVSGNREQQNKLKETRVDIPPIIGNTKYEGLSGDAIKGVIVEQNSDNISIEEATKKVVAYWENMDAIIEHDLEKHLGAENVQVISGGNNKTSRLKRVKLKDTPQP